MTPHDIARAIGDLFSVGLVAEIRVVVRMPNGEEVIYESDGFAAPLPEIVDDITKPVDPDREDE